MQPAGIVKMSLHFWSIPKCHRHSEALDLIMDANQIKEIVLQHMNTVIT